MPSVHCHKAYVAVNLDVDEEGNLYPRAIRWRDGRVFLIERLTYKCRAASKKVGGFYHTVKSRKSLLLS